jgi:hypothetical protein
VPQQQVDFDAPEGETLGEVEHYALGAATGERRQEDGDAPALLT